MAIDYHNAVTMYKDVNGNVYDTAAEADCMDRFFELLNALNGAFPVGKYAGYESDHNRAMAKNMSTFSYEDRRDIVAILHKNKVVKS